MFVYVSVYIPLQFLALSEGGATGLTNALLLVVLTSAGEEKLENITSDFTQTAASLFALMVTFPVLLQL